MQPQGKAHTGRGLANLIYLATTAMEYMYCDSYDLNESTFELTL